MPPEKRQITRNRTSYSCQTCRRRKVKCDKAHPICGTCKKTDEECVYADEEVKAPSQHAETATEPPRKRRQASWEPSHSVDSSITGDTSLGERLDEIRTLLNRVQLIIGSDDLIVNQLAGLDQQPSLGAQMPQKSTTAHFATDPSAGTSISPRESGGQRDKSPDAATTIDAAPKDPATALRKISGQLNNLSLLFTGMTDAENKSQSPQPTTSEVTPVSSGAGLQAHSSNTPNNPWDVDLAHPGHVEGPNRVIFRGWLVWVYSVLPIVDVYAVKSKYEAFYHWYSSGFDRGEPNPVHDDMPLIYAIQYGGVMGISVRGMRRWWPELPRRVLLYAIRTHYLRSAQETKPTFNGIAAAIMMRYLDVEREPIPHASSQLATLLRQAQMYGLHKNTIPGASIPDMLLRRRAWWEVVNLDASHSMSVNLPSLLDGLFFDDTLPTELKDWHVGTPAAVLYEQSLAGGAIKAAEPDPPFESRKASLISVHHLMCRGRAVLTMGARRLSVITSGVKTMQQEELTAIRTVLNDTATQVQAIIERIVANGEPESAAPPAPSKLGQSVAMDHGVVYGEDLTVVEIDCLLGRSNLLVEPMDRPFEHQMELGFHAFHRWARISLSMLLDQVCCLGFGPLARDSRTPLWAVVRNCAIEACHRFLRKFILLGTDLELERLRWTWATMFNPVHPAKVLLLDLYEMPFSNDAIRSRDLFDQMLSLGHAQCGIVGGQQGLTHLGPLEQAGPEVYALLIELRSKAWQKAGLDPAFIWNDRDQLQRAFDIGDQQLMPTVPLGPVRADQMRVPAPLEARDWRAKISDHATPFQGLHELIQKIRASATGKTDNAATSSEIHAELGSIMSSAQQSNHNSGKAFSMASTPNPIMTLKDNVLPAHNTSSARGEAAVENGQVHNRSQNDNESHTGNANQTISSWEAALSVPDSPNAFDFHRWDALFGYPNDESVQNITVADAEDLAAGFIPL